MAVVSRDNDEGLLESTKLLKLGNGGTDGVVKLEKITESTVVVESVHLLVDGGSLGHEEETVIATTLVEDVDSLEGHVLEAGEVESGLGGARGVVLEALEVLGVDVAVEPDGHGALAEDTEGLLAVVELKEGGLVQADRVALVGELLIVVLALVGSGAGDELLSTATEENIRAVLLGPRVVGHAVKGLVDERTVLATETGVAGESNGGGIGDGGSGDSAPSTTVNTAEDLDNGLDLGVVEGIRRRVGVNTRPWLALRGQEEYYSEKEHTPWR